MTFKGRPAAILIALSLSLASPALAGEPRPAKDGAPVRVYTNEDLERVRPFRGETGVYSVPAFAPGASEPERNGRQKSIDSEARGRGEAYWRREAERVRQRIDGLRERAEAVRERIRARQESRWRSRLSARRSSSSGVSSLSDPDAALHAQLAAIERRIRKLEEDLADRARRDYALPGWLR